MRQFILFFLIVLFSCTQNNSQQERESFFDQKSTPKKTHSNNSDDSAKESYPPPTQIINDIILSNAEAAHSIPMSEGCDNGWTKIRGGGPNAYYYCIYPTPQQERYDKFLDIPNYEITGDTVDKMYDYASVCAEMGADWCTVQELMAANKLGVISLNAQNISYDYNESCVLETNYTGTSTFARYPSRFCMEKEASGGDSCSGKYFFSKFNDPYDSGCEVEHEEKEYYGWHDSSYSWIEVNVFCCYR